MAPSDSELKKILAEMNHLSLKRQQLLERKKIQCIFQEMRNRAEFRQTEAAASKPQDSMDDQLKQLAERLAELQRRRDHILHAGDAKNGKAASTFTGRPPLLRHALVFVTKACSSLSEVVVAPRHVVSDVPLPSSAIFYVESPPNIPAPTVILDVEKLPHHPCRTQCPECKQFILSETSHSVSSVTWLVCFMAAMVGCVAGCCLLPFCMNSFKSTTHRCPRCRSAFMTIKKL
ncbi:uncharacterized protein LOC119220036 [Pungitius pungitius]|uniref:uncharacterized protein LOC119220036 n=1 Tax=Pungitius pungitius TaxID=134920 RepID=UPI002E14BF8A